MRLDKALVERRLLRSRTEAQARIEAGDVSVNGSTVTRPSLPVTDDDKVGVATALGPRFASRAGHKLAAALDTFDIDVAGLTCLDLGASTGGFTDCLLQRGATTVGAVDVGHGQMVPELAADPRVRLREGVNARDLKPSDFDTEFDLITADLSFISLTLVVPVIARLLRPSGRAVLLVKPQFEVGVGRLGKGGIVRDAALRDDALERVAAVAAECGLREIGRMESPIAGGDGNIEFLLGLIR